MLIGSSDVRDLVPDPPTLDAFATEPVSLPGATVLQFISEIRVSGREASLPPGLHPTNPPSVVFQFWACPQSPWGPFRLAQGRVACRSGLRPRGFVQGCVTDSVAAAEALRSQWGFPAILGDVVVDRGYDRVRAEVATGGRTVLALTGRDPDPLGNGDIAFTTTIALAQTPRGLRLVQIDCEYTANRAERVRPVVDSFERGAWLPGSVALTWPISAAVAIADITLEPHRYVSKPDELAFTGTETL
ncbi:MAG TPA: acetoacetate decarboxylase family protein [Frankiaceae bacterium]|jgi:hypothetical protein|nr:acetoacetate decarboxylase family protein [Frankiaceae bacterium]